MKHHITYVDSQKSSVDAISFTRDNTHVPYMEATQQLTQCRVHPNGTFELQMLRICSLILRNSTPSSSILIFEQQIFALNPNPWRKGGSTTLAVSASFVPYIEEPSLEKTWRTNRPNCVVVLLVPFPVKPSNYSLPLSVWR